MPVASDGWVRWTLEAEGPPEEPALLTGAFRTVGAAVMDRYERAVRVAELAADAFWGRVARALAATECGLYDEAYWELLDAIGVSPSGGRARVAHRAISMVLQAALARTPGEVDPEAMGWAGTAARMHFATATDARESGPETSLPRQEGLSQFVSEQKLRTMTNV